MNNTTTTDLTHFDVRTLPCRAKHAMIFQRWSDLPVGSHFIIVNDHDPVPLYYQFSGLFGDAFSWEYLEAPADEFHVKITRLAETSAVSAKVPPPRPCNGEKTTPLDVDARGLEPPEPMLRILAEVEKLPHGARLRAFTDRRPVHLFPELTARGIRFGSEELPDGSWSTILEKL